MQSSLEDLLRASALRYGHIQLFRDASGWQADICHYPVGQERRDTRGGQVFADPADALRTVLVEDDRVGRELARKYAGAARAAAPKGGPNAQHPDADGACMLCEGGGCDLCRPASVAVDLSEFGL